MCSTNIQIAVKIRPFIEKEKREKLEPLWLVEENSIVQIDSSRNFIGEPYCFDHIFDHTKSNKDVYHAVVKPLVMSCLKGINSTIFAYGQTSSGKTHTMLGDKGIPGIITFTVEDIFAHIQENTTKNFLLRCSYLEIYNEKINDLLDTNARDVKIREDYNQAVYAVVKEEVIRQPEELISLIKKGMKTRKIGCTDMNERSSRSHTIFKLVIQSQHKESEGSYTESTLNLVDLAGSERVGQMNMGRERQVEGVSINKSLTTLGLVIRRLSENESYINYRDSKLTRLLQHSLGGNSRTLIISTITLAASEETKSTLEFAQRAKYVKNRPIINERVTDKDQLKQYERLCGDYKEQIEKLKRERIEQDKTINVLEDKISNIELFTAGSLEKIVKPQRIPQRRHTLAHYNDFAIIDSGELEDNSDEGKFLSPVKSEVCFRITNTDNEETPLLDDSVCSFAHNTMVSKEHNSPKTPSAALRKEKALLEESYVSLKMFTSLEKQVQGKSNELEELRELTGRLRDENIKLREENMQRNDIYIKFIEGNDDVYRKLLCLRTILEVKPFEEQRRKSLHTIIEEDADLFNEELDLPISSNINDITDTCAPIITDNRYLKEQIEEQNSIIVALKEDISSEKLNKEVIQLREENECLRSEIDTRNALIDQLKSNIIQDKNIKEAELEILNDKIKRLNDYKEEMHKQLSELQRKEMLPECNSRNSNLNEYLALDKENCRLKAELQDSLDELSEKKKKLEMFSEQFAEKNRHIDSLERALSDFKIGSSNLVLRNKILGIGDETKTLHEAEEKTANDINQTTILNEKTYEFYQEELENVRKHLDIMALMIKGKGEHHYFEKNVAFEGPKKEKEEVNNKLSTFSAKPKMFELYSLLKEHLKQIENLEKEKNQLHSKLTEFKETHNDMMVENKQLLVKIRDLEEEKRQLEQQSACLKQTDQSYISNIHSLESTSQAQKSEIIQLKDQIYSYRNDMKSLQDSFNAQVREITELKNQLRLKQEELNDRRNSYNDALSNCEINMKECKQLQEKVCKLEEEKIQLNRMNEYLNHTIQGHLKEIQIMRTAVNTQEANINDLNTRLNLKQAELHQQTQSYIDTLSTYEMKVVECKELQKKVDNFQEQFERINAALKETEGNEEVNSKVGAFLLVEERLKQIETLKKETNQLQSKLTEFKEKSEAYNDMTIENKQLSDKIRDLEEEKRHLEQQSIYLKQTVDSLESASHAQKSEIIQLKDQFNMKLKELDEKKIEYNKMQIGYENRNHQFYSYRNDLERLQDSFNAQVTEITELKKQLRLKQEELNERTNLYNDALSNNEIDMKECKQLQEKVYKFQEEKIQLARINESLEQKIEIHLQTIQTLQTTSDCQNSKITALQTQLHLKETELVKKEKCYYDTFSDYKVKVDECEQLRRKVEHFEKEKILLDRKNEDLKQIIQSHLKKIQILRNRADTQEENIKDLNTQLNMKQVELQERAKSYNDMLSNYENKVVECQELEKKVASFQEQLQQMNAALKETQQLNLSGGETLPTNDLKELNINMLDNHKLVAEIRLKSEEIETINEARNQLKALISDYKVQVKERCEDYINLKKKYYDLEIELLTCKEGLKSNKQELAKEKQKLWTLNTALQSSGIEYKHLSVEEQVTKLVLKIKHLEQELLNARQEIQSRTLQIEEYKQHKKKFKEASQKQLEASEHQITSLQATINNLTQTKKRTCDVQPDKNPVSRLSNEFRQLSPNDLRRIKRQSIHDQRRGLSPDLENTIDDDNLGCSNCLILKANMSDMKKENKSLAEEINVLKKESQFLDKENEDMLGIIKDLEKKKIELNEQLRKNKTVGELEGQLLDNIKMMEAYHLRSAQLDSEELQSDYRGARAISHKLDKETQATCDLHQKYMNLKKVAVLRRREGNYLRTKLNLPPDCPVLSGDLQNLQKSDPF